MARLFWTDGRRLSKLWVALAVALALCACAAQPPASMATRGPGAIETAAPTTAMPRASAVARADMPSPLETARPGASAAGAPATASRTPVATSPVPIRAFQNPVIARDFPDPEILQSGGHFYAYATNSGRINVQVARSVDLVTWEPLPDALPTLPAWARTGRTWAPDVTRTAEGWVLYFTSWHAASGRQCIGAATAASPVGPFRPLAAPLVCPLASGGAIDPSSFVDVDGGRYLIWKNDGNCCGLETYIYAQPMMPDGLSFAAGPTPLIRADRPWEGGVVEAPTVYRRGGIYHLFYSANGYEGAAYAIGHAQGVTLAKPLAKDAAPLAQTAAGITGPGGQDLIEMGGATWLAYHRWADGGAYRAMDLGRVAWEGDRPLFTPTREPQPLP